MPIEALTVETVLQRCAVCQAVATVPLVTLTVGIGSQVPGDVDGRVVQLPACATCKSQEYLVRSEAGGGSAHQVLVDQLHSQLAKAGRVDKRLTGLVVKDVPPEVVKQVFPAGFTLPPAATEKLGP